MSKSNIIKIKVYMTTRKKVSK